MSECQITVSREAENWPEGLISAKLTMSPYVLAMAGEESLKNGMKLWEFINLAVWEKLGKPTRQELIAHAADLEVFDEDPKWKKRLKIAARHELAVNELHKDRMDELKESSASDNGETTEN
jgi:hypothetical protein